MLTRNCVWVELFSRFSVCDAEDETNATKQASKAQRPCESAVEPVLSPPFPIDHSIDFVAMDVAVNAAAGALKAFFADLPDPLIPYSLHPELVEAASKSEHTPESFHLMSPLQNITLFVTQRKQSSVLWNIRFSNCQKAVSMFKVLYQSGSTFNLLYCTSRP